MKHNENLSFWQHLSELRRRLIICLISIAIASSIVYIFTPNIFLWLKNYLPHLIFIGPAEAFIVKLKVAVICGLVLASPIILYECWRFVLPALYKHERRCILPTLCASYCFFILGLCFGLFLLLPVGLKFLIHQSAPLEPYISIDKLVNFISWLSLVSGLIFQLPVALLVLVRVGVLSPQQLRRVRRYVIVVIFIVAAVLTPPDIISQLMIAMPLLILYECSIWVSYIVVKRHG